MILGINLFYVCVNSNFDFFVNVKSCFEFPIICEKGQIILRDSVIRKGIGGPFIKRSHQNTKYEALMSNTL